MISSPLLMMGWTFLRIFACNPPSFRVRTSPLSFSLLCLGHWQILDAEARRGHS